MLILYLSSLNLVANPMLRELVCYIGVSTSRKNKNRNRSCKPDVTGVSLLHKETLKRWENVFVVANPMLRELVCYRSVNKHEMEMKQERCKPDVTGVSLLLRVKTIKKPNNIEFRVGCKPDVTGVSLLLNGDLINRPPFSFVANPMLRELVCYLFIRSPLISSLKMLRCKPDVTGVSLLHTVDTNFEFMLKLLKVANPMLRELVCYSTL